MVVETAVEYLVNVLTFHSLCVHENVEKMCFIIYF